MADVQRIELHDHTYSLPRKNVATIRDILIKEEKEESEQNETIIMAEKVDRKNVATIRDILIKEEKEESEQNETIIMAEKVDRKNVATIRDNLIKEEKEESEQNETIIMAEKVDTEKENAAVNVRPIQLEEAVTYTILPGAQLKSRIFMDNLNYRYYKKAKSKGKIYLVCEQSIKDKFCPSTAYISSDIDDNYIRTFMKHNHLPPSTNLSMVYLRRAIKLARTKSHQRFKTSLPKDDKKVVRNVENGKRTQPSSYSNNPPPLSFGESRKYKLILPKTTLVNQYIPDINQLCVHPFSKYVKNGKRTQPSSYSNNPPPLSFGESRKYKLILPKTTLVNQYIPDIN